MTRLLLSLLLVSCVTPQAQRAPLTTDPHGPVLFLLSSAAEQPLQNGTVRATGFFLGEFYEAWRAVKEAGFEVVIATPNGSPPVIDPESLKPAYWKLHPAWREEAQALLATLTWRSFDEVYATQESFSGLVVPGGQGVMIDVLSSSRALELVSTFGHSGRPVGLICHAPAMLTRLAPEKSPFAGRQVTSVSGLEEFFIESFIMGGRATTRDIGGQLRQQGLLHRNAFPGQPFAVRDGNLVTSQNPASGEVFAEHYRQALADWLLLSGGR
jgi:putative intracellular protease/amidase